MDQQSNAGVTFCIFIAVHCFPHQPMSNGYIAVILPKHHERENVMSKLLSPEQYEEAIKKRKEMPDESDSVVGDTTPLSDASGTNNSPEGSETMGPAQEAGADIAGQEDGMDSASRETAASGAEEKAEASNAAAGTEAL